MAFNLQHNLVHSRISNPHLAQKATLWKDGTNPIYLSCYKGNLRQRWIVRRGFVEYDRQTIRNGILGHKNYVLPFWKAKRMLFSTSLLATNDDGMAASGTSQTSSGVEVEEMRTKLNQSIQGEDLNSSLIQALHDAARVFELAIKEHTSGSRVPWFSKAWLGVDKHAWVKTLSYQASVHSLLQAGSEIASRGDGRDRDTNVFVQRSLLRQSTPLESIIREELVAKEPAVYDWFWSQQHPMVVTSFVNFFERDPRFSLATAVWKTGASLASGNGSDLSLLMLALSCIAAITKLGPAKVSCPQFFSSIPDVTGRLMDMLVDFIPVRRAYQSMKEVGLRREFLVHFGPRAASLRGKNDKGAEEMAFWVNLVQQQLQRAIDREKIWSRLTTTESIEVLEKDLAIFGIFIALGRSTQSFLSANNIDIINDSVESLIRYLIGGSVLYYPQLSSISAYQLYVEVVCEELEWLPFYPNHSGALKRPHENKGKQVQGLPKGEAISQVLDVCSYWMQNFIKYSAWLENSSNVKAAEFLSRGHSKLKECRQRVGFLKNERGQDGLQYSHEQVDTASYTLSETELDSFDMALESVDDALKRLEELLQELHVCSSNSGKEHLKAACSDLERIRKLKKEAEFLEASFRAKAASLQQGVDDRHLDPSLSKQKSFSKKKHGKKDPLMQDGTESKRGSPARSDNGPHGLWSFLLRRSTRQIVSKDDVPSRVDQTATDPCEETYNSTDNGESEPNEIRRFELLRCELIELEKRVQRSTDGTQNEEENIINESELSVNNSALGSSLAPLVQVQKKEGIIGKSIDKLKETTTDVLQGTQLLAIDVAAAMVLLRRAITGDELTEKEKKSLRRTLIDLASVIPIGILMLLPVTAVGHAAILAAIQRYVPALIPSAYAPERLDLLRQLEKVKEMEDNDGSPDDSGVAQAREN
ncbi:uncharacterized protein LOC18426964 isoform X1 [Amborella trichopoda]|uniref:Uncharacterized protein n=1 Tax=Amborella trichopoda TaxID=13333 RepID=W1NW77_AMBTC|nr:uncharacterized protein LOC18426964 isoform X1 [Amborella trichopoda]ERM98939.1 hypothetical protein AMTR_s00114p00128980 [Amborella trichopoda]|eukprot:XP_006836086.1 uncharacterized protein LOC18426964 isoform X1 [Amborella trichopoda]